MGASTADFASQEAAERSPLASALFALPGVSRVFLGTDFITVTKTEDEGWQALKPQVLGTLMEHFVSGRPTVDTALAVAAEEDVSPEDQEIVRSD